MGMLADVTLIPNNVSVGLQPHLSEFSFRTNLFSAAEGRAPPAPCQGDTAHTAPTAKTNKPEKQVTPLPNPSF